MHLLRILLAGKLHEQRRSARAIRLVESVTEGTVGRLGLDNGGSGSGLGGLDLRVQLCRLLLGLVVQRGLHRRQLDGDLARGVVCREGLEVAVDSGAPELLALPVFLVGFLLRIWRTQERANLGKPTAIFDLLPVLCDSVIVVDQIVFCGVVEAVCVDLVGGVVGDPDGSAFCQLHGPDGADVGVGVLLEAEVDDGAAVLGLDHLLAGLVVAALDSGAVSVLGVAEGLGKVSGLHVGLGAPEEPLWGFGLFDGGGEVGDGVGPALEFDGSMALLCQCCGGHVGCMYVCCAGMMRVNVR